MSLICNLKRTEYGPNGVFGDFTIGAQKFATLEHAYFVQGMYSDGTEGEGYFPKIPFGEFECIRGIHKLDGMIKPIHTFEVTGVVGHTGLLFHLGNFQEESQGCILLGLKRVDNMVVESRKAFLSFMNELIDIDRFTLIVDNDKAVTDFKAARSAEGVSSGLN